MAEKHFVRELFRQWRPNAAASSFRGVLTKGTYEQQYYYSTATATNGENCEKEKNYNQWLILPPFTPTADGSSIGKELYGRPADTNTTALKWILKCCPHLPRCLVQKLFRLRQIGAKDLMDIGDKIFLPKSVDGKSPSKTVENQSFSNEEEMKFIHSLELYKGGLGIKSSLDELAAKYLRYDYSESPRLVHRLDRDSSGILVMGRTQLSTTILHSIFREKTFGASNDVPGSDRILQKKYYALVIGSPRRREGLISVPLMKVVVDNGKSERITVVDNNHTLSVQHSATEYRLRVHCAEVLGTPIVGDYKYGWQAHKKLGQYFDSASDLKRDDKMTQVKHNIIGLELENGSISDKQPFLHLHCKKMILPNISLALQRGRIISTKWKALGRCSFAGTHAKKLGFTELALFSSIRRKASYSHVEAILIRKIVFGHLWLNLLYCCTWCSYMPGSAGPMNLPTVGTGERTKTTPIGYRNRVVLSKKGNTASHEKMN
ncbi:hypothetical protein DH2020_023917 [Rehmannia glutinosa]|uniref:Pseudouridine synthase RsuA/RluA-like domain-containing protein n=1 Tax=Rehmannia glutinosa TaxID=99300 RepID=A0ABR0WBV9_REHGL